MIEHVCRRAQLCGDLDEVYVATCDREIADCVEGFGGNVLMTANTHERASDRVAEAVTEMTADVIVMLQGDEPLIHPKMISQAIAPIDADAEVVCVNLAGAINGADDLNDPNTVKVVVDQNGDALYFSRQPIPHNAQSERVPNHVYKQVCVIPFRYEFLMRYAALPQTPLENAESVDMLRVLEHGYRVRMVPTEFVTQAVDIPDDVAVVERMLRDDPLSAQYA